MSSSAGETFAGFTVLVLLSAVICAPALGWTGIIAAFTAIYFGAHFVAGAASGGRRRRR
jgi:hypothetical protein